MHTLAWRLPLFVFISIKHLIKNMCIGNWRPQNHSTGDFS